MGSREDTDLFDLIEMEDGRITSAFRILRPGAWRA